MSFKQKNDVFFGLNLTFFDQSLAENLNRDNNTGKDLQQLRRICFDKNLP